MVAGPSEILIVADKSAKPSFLAADLMSQAEHDKMASAILLTTSETVARATVKEIERQIKYLERQEIIERSLEDYGEIIVGRMGIPDKTTGINTISLIVNGDTEKISALCGKLGRIDDVNVKSAVMTVDNE